MPFAPTARRYPGHSVKLPSHRCPNTGSEVDLLRSAHLRFGLATSERFRTIGVRTPIQAVYQTQTNTFNKDTTESCRPTPESSFPVSSATPEDRLRQLSTPFITRQLLAQTSPHFCGWGAARVKIMGRFAKTLHRQYAWRCRSLQLLPKH